MERGPGRRWWLVVVQWVVVACAVWWFTRTARRVDWGGVGEALTTLAAWEALVLLLVVGVRAVLNASPLAVLVPGLGLRHALANDLSANLVATVAPPPSDVVLRLAMLRDRGVDATTAVPGIALNTVTYYVARFGAPVLGGALALAVGTYEPVYTVSVVGGGLVAGAVLVALALARRRERQAVALARWAGVQARRVVRSVDPDAWAVWAESAVGQANRALARGLSAVLACQLGLVLTEAVLLLLSFRFVGVPASVASAAQVLVALLVAYPLTALPFAGLGVLDAAVLSLLSLEGDPAAVAAFIVFRVCWILVPLLAGAVTTVAWRRGRVSTSTDA